MRNKFKFNEKLKRCTAFLLVCLMVIGLLPTTSVQAATTLYNEATLKVLKSSKEYDLTPAGVNKKGVVYRMELDGTEGFCMDAGQHAKSGNRYARRDDKKVDETYRKLISFAFYDDVAARILGTTIGEWSDSNYALAQALVWIQKPLNMAIIGVIMVAIILLQVVDSIADKKERKKECELPE